MLKDEVLALLMENKGGIVTGGSLAKRLGVSRTAIWKIIRSLRDEGCEIESLPNSGYRFMSAGDMLSGRVIRGLLTARFFGDRLDVLETTASTNRYIKDMAARDGPALPEGFAVLADGQTGGRGRMGRSFASPHGEGVYLSVLLKPAIPPDEIHFLTICAAVAVSDALRDVCGFEPAVKWVNDIYYGDKKLCGILTEAVVSAEMGAIDSVVTGMGINTGTVADEVRDTATSVAEITGRRGFRNAIAAGILNRFEQIYLDFTRDGKKRDILAAYAARQSVVGRTVLVSGPGFEPYEAIPEGIDDDGRLIVRKKNNGAEIRLNSGEVSLKIEK